MNQSSILLDSNLSLVGEGAILSAASPNCGHFIVLTEKESASLAVRHGASLAISGTK